MAIPTSAAANYKSGAGNVEWRHRINADETLKLVEDNAEALTGSPMSPADTKTIQEIISVVGDMDKLTVHSRLEGGQQRSSIHFKTN